MYIVLSLTRQKQYTQAKTTADDNLDVLGELTYKARFQLNVCFENFTIDLSKDHG